MYSFKYFIVVRVPVCTARIYFFAVIMSSHQTSSNKPRSSKCRHFCFTFDTHNYCPTCRESGKGDDPCGTNEKPWNICSGFTNEQHIKMKHRRRYVRKPKMSNTCHTSKDDDLDLFGDDMEAFLDLKQTLRVLQKTYFHLLHAPNPYILSLCL